MGTSASSTRRPAVPQSAALRLNDGTPQGKGVQTPPRPKPPVTSADLPHSPSSPEQCGSGVQTDTPDPVSRFSSGDDNQLHTKQTPKAKDDVTQEKIMDVLSSLAENIDSTVTVADLEQVINSISDSDDDNTNDDDDDKSKEMMKVLDRLLKKHRKTYKQTAALWDGASKSRDQTNKAHLWTLVEHLERVCSSYFDFRDNRFSLKLQREYCSKAGDIFVDTGNVPVLCDAILDSLGCRRYVKVATVRTLPTEGQVPDTREDVKLDILENRMLQTALLALWNFTDGKAATCRAVRDHGKFIPELVTLLEDLRLRHGTDLPTDVASEEKTIITAGISIIHNVAMDDECIVYVRQVPGLGQLLKTFVTAAYSDLWKFLAICTLADILTDAEADQLTTTSDVLEFLLDCVGMAVNSKNHQADIAGTGASYAELVRAVKHLSRNNVNSRLLVEKGAVPLLYQGLQSEFEEEKKVSIESLWWLSFLKDNHKAIMDHEGLVEHVMKVWRDKDDPCKAAAEGMLFQLRDILREHSQPHVRAVAQEFYGDKTKLAKRGHVMLSYQRNNRTVVKLVCDYLKKNGIPVWLDIYNMAEGGSSTAQTMAEAVEGAVVFLMCVSENYKNSQYCRQEAEYAFEKGKHIIPLKLQQGYRADGWLGFIMGSRFFYDLSQQALHADKLQQLLSAVKKATESGNVPHDCVDGPSTHATTVMEQTVLVDTSHGGLTYAAPTSDVTFSTINKIRFWTREEVTKWLEKYKLQGKAIQALTGMEIVFLRQLNEKAPEYFYQLLVSQLQLKTVSEMAAFTYALEEVYTML